MPEFTSFTTAEALLVDKKSYQEQDLLKTLILFADQEFDEEHSVAEYIFKELQEEEIWPVSKEFETVFKDAYAYLLEHKMLNELYFIRNPSTSKMAAGILSQRHKLSPGWEDNFEK